MNLNPFGPHCAFELARVSRRQRLIAGRCAFVALVLVILGFIYLSLFGRGPESLWDFLFRSTAKPNDLANFGMMFFMIYTFMQYFIATFAMAATSASIIAEEKEKHTLPFLLTTTLANREIIFGKLAARVAQVLMLLGAALPVLAIMQVMGGIDPVLLWTSFVAIFACILSAAGVGAAISVRAPSVKSATSQAVGCVAAYLFLMPWLGFGILRAYGGIPLLPLSLAYFTLADLIDWLNAGNLIWVTERMGRVAFSSGSLTPVLMPILMSFVGFHLIVAALTGGWTAFRLRKIIAKQQDSADKSTSKKGKERKAQQRTPVSQNRPVFWREMKTAIGKSKQKWWHRWFKRLLFFGSFLPLIMVIYEGTIGRRGGSIRIGRDVHELVRGLGTMVLSGVILHVAVTASAMIGRERRQKTFEELALTDLSNREILRDKAWAAAFSAKWALIWLAIHWAIDLLVGGMSPLVLLIVPPIMAMYIFLAARFGMMCSAFETPKIRAATLAALGMLAFAGLPWLLPFIHALLVDFHGNDVEYTAMFAAGISPPAVLGILTLGADDLRQLKGQSDEFRAATFVVGLVVGMSICFIVSMVAWRKTKRRFAKSRPE